MSVFRGIDNNCFQCIIIINLNFCQFFSQFAPKIFLDGHVFPYNVCFFPKIFNTIYVSRLSKTFLSPLALY